MISLSLLLAAFLPVIPQPSSWTPSNEQPYNVSEDRVRWEIVSDRGLGDEGYEMMISPTGILAVAESETGLRWARQTYAQLASRGGTIPSGTIRDRPKYRVRSLMIDVGRTFIELDFLRQLVKDMAYYKFNNLHIHLNDDGARMFCTNGYHAFRLECETYPDLTAKDGHYTKAEFRAFIKEAAAQGVTVLPEIDTPSHAGCFRGVKALAEKGVDGIDLRRMDVVCPFMEKLFAEYLDGDDPVFAGKYVHVGTDEYLGDGELFRKYSDWMFKMVRRHGHEPQAWGSLSHRPGKTPVLADGDIIMDIWHCPYYDPREALKAGYKIITVPADPLYIVPASGYYNDYLDLGWIYAHWEPCNVGGAYFPFDIAPDHPQLLGGKFAVWNDISGNGISDDDIFERVFPALQVLGQKLWSGATGQSYDDFKRLASETFEAPGVNLADRLTGPDGTIGPGDRAVGWTQGGYEVSFTLSPKTKGAIDLFDDGTSRVWWSDGRLAFARDGYEHVFECSILPGSSSLVVFTGDATGVDLTVDGRAVGSTKEMLHAYEAKKNGKSVTKYIRKVRTLHFPLVDVAPKGVVSDMRVKVFGYQPDKLVLRAGRVEVVVAPDAPKVTRFAATELTNFLSQVLGGEVPLVETFTGWKNAFVLGTNKWSNAAGVKPQELPRDGYRIRTAPGRIYIAGCDDPVKDGFFVARHGGMNDQFHEHGTLFGVYEFLERFAGVRYYFPGELGTIVPRKDRIEVPEVDIFDAPAYRSARHYQVYWDGEYFEGPKPKVTVNPAKTIQYYRNRMETEVIPCCHGSNVFRYLDRFGETHPEYFAILPNGERSLRGAKYPCHPGQLCWTSGIVEEMYQDIRSYLTGEPATVRKILAWNRKGYGWSGNCVGGKYVDVMPQDGFTGCRCERCLAAYSKTDKVHYATELIWSNTVYFAKRLKEEKIPGYVVMMAYRPYRRVPDFDIPDNVLVQVAETGPWSLTRPAELAKENAEIRAWTEKLGRKVWLWNYVGKVARLNLPGIPCLAPNAWGEYYASLEPWIDGAFAETSKCDRWFYNYLNYYIFGKVCWNPKVDWKALLEEHYRLMFGPAAPEMRELYETLERKWTREIAGKSVDTPLGPVGDPPGAYEIWMRVYSPELLKHLDGLCRRAKSKVVFNSLEARRIDLVRREFYVPLEKESRRYLKSVDIDVEMEWRNAHRGLRNLLEGVGPIKVCSTGEVSETLHYLDKEPGRLKPGVRYRLSYLLKMKNVVQTGKGGGAGVRLWDDKNVWFPGFPEARPCGTTDGWIAQSFEFTSGLKTNVDVRSFINFGLRNASGEAEFDRIELLQLEGPGIPFPVHAAGSR